ncbi:MAG: hypothetical protein ACR2JV_02180, partial [Gaiellales bacterium]
MSTQTRTVRYDRHRRRAAARRRRVLLLLVLAVAFTVVGVALAYPKLRTVTPEAAPKPASVAKPAKAKAEAVKPAAAGTTMDDASAAASADTATTATAAGGGIGANGLPIVTTKQPDWQPTPQAQAAIDRAMAHGRPPQFLVSSFDGAADIDMYRIWLPLAQRLGARFTFFVSGIYMLLPQYKDAYQPPHKPVGFSNLGGYAELAGSKGALQNLRDNWEAFNVARMMGNEIGSHYVSHICDESNTWTTSDWVSESSQWERLMLDVSAVNHL